MKIEVFPDPDAAAKAAARLIAVEARDAIAQRGRFVIAFSGGRSPGGMLRALAREDLPWDKVHILQVDERVAPRGDPDRNLTHLRESLLADAPVPLENVHAMPVEAPDLEAAATHYALALQGFAGSPPILDFVHLGLGPDGHTASLVPGDPVLEVTNADVGVTGSYQGHRRMTLTFPALNSARRILWFVTDGYKAEMLARLGKSDPSIPAGRVRQDAAIIIADKAAAGMTETKSG